jgi:integrase
MKNKNHPKKGARTAVDPIRSRKDINSISKLLTDKPRNLLLFKMGINNGLRTGDLLRIKVKDVRKMKPGDSVNIKEQKTGKENILMVNKAVYKALRSYLNKEKPDDGDYLFPSQKGGHLEPLAVNKLMKKWTSAINLEGNYGCHTLRKTFGYIQRTKFGVGFEILCKRFGHSNPSITMRYLGIQDKEVNGILMNDI